MGVNLHRFLHFWFSFFSFLFYEFRRDESNAYYEYRRVPPRTKPPANLFGRRLREARQRAGVPQDKLGVAIGLDETTASARISRYETGVHEPPMEVSKRIAQTLGVLPPYFYCEDDDLAELIVAWGQLTQIDRASVKEAVLALLDEEQS